MGIVTAEPTHEIPLAAPCTSLTSRAIIESSTVRTEQPYIRRGKAMDIDETQARWTEWLAEQLAVMTSDEVKAVLTEASRIRQESWDRLEARMSFDDCDGMAVYVKDGTA